MSRIRVDIATLLVSKIKSADNRIKRVVPLVAEANTQFPYVVYERASSEQATTKDLQSCIANADVIVKVYSDDYDESLSVCQKIVDAVADIRLYADGISIISSVVADGGEAWVSDAYCQQFTLSLKYNY